jgi:hypothetical protein
MRLQRKLEMTGRVRKKGEIKSKIEGRREFFIIR